jgi:hypothetical protein
MSCILIHPSFCRKRLKKEMRSFISSDLRPQVMGIQLFPVGSQGLQIELPIRIDFVVNDPGDLESQMACPIW